MKKGPSRARLWGAGLVAITIVAAAGAYMLLPMTNSQNKAVAAQGQGAPPAVPVSVSIVQPKSVKL